MHELPDDVIERLAELLPDEWIASWDADSLGAGAVAVKTYAAYRAETGRARTSGAGCYDILDTTSDQVFDPSWSTEATDEAVDATMMQRYLPESQD